ncbi:hypothetical protein DYBT9623_02515 [Dyadobacter sp. CECT 9623]|uniref:Uncharacterized protein n=1 Tax=Dyadobacter linearis TaxID=2823330 RepID=A0ABM8UQI2_9BACT|nr:hypothetical protein DYBT9623_02515 [Dyadobacter sp. CECT 9623]
MVFVLLNIKSNLNDKCMLDVKNIQIGFGVFI